MSRIDRRGSRPKPFDEQRARELRAEGWSYRRIGRALGLQASLVRRRLLGERCSQPLGWRSKTINARHLTREAITLGTLLYPPHPDDEPRPATRGDCEGGPRPCPWTACRHHLFLDVDPATGSIKLNYPGRELADLPETCALDVADQGEHTLENVGELLNLTRERVRQLEVSLLVRVRQAASAMVDALP